MSQNQLMKRMLDAGMAFTQMTQAKAEGIVKELVSVGEVRVEEAQQQVASLLEKGRETSEALVALVRSEVQRQLHALGLMGAPAAAPATAPAAVKKAVESTTAAVKKAVASTTAATPAKAVKKAVAKKAAPAKAAVKKAAVKKAAVKKAAPAAARDAAGVRKVATKKASTARTVARRKSS
jgi:polyhydroxyalkanoate synthesis regulator phasin